MKFEVVNNKDGSRMSRAHRGNSTTLFDSKAEADAWMRSVGITDAAYSVKEAR